MAPMEIPNATHKFVAPQEMPDCQPLFVRVHEGVCYSHWEFTPAEVAAINAGGFLRVAVVGHQPPMGMRVGTFDDGIDRAVPAGAPDAG